MPQEKTGIKIRGLRWYIAGLIGLATALNYMDRQTLSILWPTLQHDLGFSKSQYRYLPFWFLISYTIMYAVGGRLVDYLGARRGFAIFVSGWSLVDALHAFANKVWQFASCRFLLGVTEAGNFPAGIKAISEWFPVKERALAVGIFNAGTALGPAIAAPIITGVTLWLGWRYTFIAGAILSITWVLAWLLLYRTPQQHPCITAEELKMIEESQGPSNQQKVSVLNILRTREAWGCILARVFTDPISYFFVFWIPIFLQQERGFDLKAMGEYYWIPFVGLGLGNLAGGAIPGWLIRRGWTLNRSRKTVMFISSLIIPVSFIAIAFVPNRGSALACTTVAMFFHAAWANMTLPAEVFPKHVVGTVTGIGGAAGSLVSAVAMLAIGQTITVSSFTPVFIIYSALPMTAFILVCVFVRRLGDA